MSSNVNKIGNPYNQNGQPLININQQTLDEISEKNGWITFKNKKLSKAISFVEYNNQELSVNSDSSSTIYNNQFEDIQKIIFVNAQLSVNPYNQTQLFVKCKNNNNGENLNVDYFNIKFVNGEQINLNNKDFIICNRQNNLMDETIQTTFVYLPIIKDSVGVYHVKISTLQNINANNKVVVTVNQAGVFIDRSGNIQLQIQSPYSSIQLVYDFSYKLWRVITPFIPMQRRTVGLTSDQVKKVTNKILMIRG